MTKIIGRKKEIERLDRIMEENEAQLVMVYGRRRVGKTFLINKYFEDRFDFKFTGAFDKSTKEQLQSFCEELNRMSRGEFEIPNDWSMAFSHLRDYLDSLNTNEKRIVFMDEMPWMDRMRSGFLSAFEWFWNAWGSAQENLVFIVCGSAAAWMTEKLDHNKGGLFHRHTARLYLEPFCLRETKEYLQSRNIYWSEYDITQCYMIMGGIPYYLRLLDSSYSLNENIDHIFFEKRAELWDEFNQLFRTLFSESEPYKRIVEELSKKRSGLKRDEIAKRSGISLNGKLSRMLNNLEYSGFVRVNDMFGLKKREKIYQLCDYYTLFYFRFIKDYYGKDEQMWSNSSDLPARAAWAGLTYEQVCKDHIAQIKKKIGISGVMTEISSWEKKGNDEEGGAQIDLLIDRRDHVINLCEIKFSINQYEIGKDEDMSLRNKVNTFRNATKTNKTIQLTMITSYGIKRNMYSNFISKEVCMEDLFQAL